MAHSQSYEFAQHILPEEIWLDTARTWTILNDPAAAPALLQEWWALAHAYSGTQAPALPPAGLSASPCQVAGGPALLFSFPQPQAAGEAFLALLVLGELGAPRYFLLEAATPELTTTVIGERQSDAATHHSHGPGPTPGTDHTAAGFLAQVTHLLLPTS